MWNGLILYWILSANVRHELPRNHLRVIRFFHFCLENKNMGNLRDVRIPWSSSLPLRIDPVGPAGLVILLALLAFYRGDPIAKRKPE